MPEPGRLSSTEKDAVAIVGSSDSGIATETPKKATSFKKVGQALKKVFTPRKSSPKAADEVADKVADKGVAVSPPPPPAVKPAENTVAAEEPPKDEPPPKKNTRVREN